MYRSSSLIFFLSIILSSCSAGSNSNAPARIPLEQESREAAVLFRPSMIRANGTGLVLKSSDDKGVQQCFDAVSRDAEIDERISIILGGCPDGRWCRVNQGGEPQIFEMTTQHEIATFPASYRLEEGELVLSSAASYRFREIQNFVGCPLNNESIDVYYIVSIR